MTRLRPMRWQDLPAVHGIEQRAFAQDPWSPAGLWSELAARPRRDYIVLEEAVPDGPDSRAVGEVVISSPAGAGLIGYAGLDLAGESSDVMTIAVDPRRRGEGHGTVLLQALLERAVRGGASQVMLEVRADNEEAIGLYRRHGFAEVHRRRGYYQPGAVDALIMRREVEPGG